MLQVLRNEDSHKFEKTEPPGGCRVGRAGDWVEVRSKDEILATLDERGRLDGMPFMPEMLRYCGQQFQVYKRAHKTCDTISGAYPSRSVADSVHLDLRCDGSAHGGCQAGCLLFWNTAWLKSVERAERDGAPFTRKLNALCAGACGSGCSEQTLQSAVQRFEEAGQKRYVCQATELFDYTKPLKWWDARQFIEDCTSGNVSMSRFMNGVVFATFVFLTQARRQTLGKPGRWLYDKIQSLWGGQTYPRFTGHLAPGAPTPREDLNLQPGDIVRVRSLDAIQSTIDTLGANRNMNFGEELVPYCGRMFKVRNRVEKFVDERNGKLRTMKTPAVILDGVYCQSCYSRHRMFCPRAIYAWWREVWLERVTPDQTES